MSKECNKQDKYSLRFGSWRFTPTLKLSIITLILFCILVYLGVWQVQRAVYKKNLLHSLQAKSAQPAKSIDFIKDASLDKARFTPVQVEGVFLNNYTFLLDNQMLNHKPGFRVLTPLHSPQLQKWILIDMGWVPRGKSRADLPEIPPVYGFKNFTALINTVSSGIVLKKDLANNDETWPKIIQTLDYSYIESQLKRPVFEFVLQIANQDLKHFEYPPQDYGFNSDKNWGYALQWFIFAALLLMYYFITTIKRSR